MHIITDPIHNHPQIAKAVAIASILTGLVVFLGGALILTSHFLPHSPIGFAGDFMGSLYVAPPVMLLGIILTSAGFGIIWIATRKGKSRSPNYSEVGFQYDEHSNIAHVSILPKQAESSPTPSAQTTTKSKSNSNS